MFALCRCKFYISRKRRSKNETQQLFPFKGTAIYWQPEPIYVDNWLASGGSTVVEHSPHPPMVKSSSPTDAGTKRERDEKVD